jgi:phosphatidylserine/phosphatidylglycerophosphate/cardiolipin synthase-like enzyme
MLNKDTEKAILDFVYEQPRSIQEIAHAIDKNWRTADSYVEKIAKETGQLSTRIFRGGTRGALKIVFWSKTEKLSSNDFQERMFRRIEIGRKKEDFSPFELYTYVAEDHRKAWKTNSNGKSHKNIVDLISNAKEQVLVFTGNCSFINLVEHGVPVTGVLRSLLQRGVNVKILSRVDIASITNLQQLLAINHELGREGIEVRHAEQPLRGFVIDDKVVRLKEELSPVRYRAGELEKDTILLYEIYDPAWVKWVQNVFWAMFRTSLSGQKRLEDLRSIHQS